MSSIAMTKGGCHNRGGWDLTPSRSMDLCVVHVGAAPLVVEGLISHLCV
jgi:hypothetical protein